MHQRSPFRGSHDAGRRHMTAMAVPSRRATPPKLKQAFTRREMLTAAAGATVAGGAGFGAWKSGTGPATGNPALSAASPTPSSGSHGSLMNPSPAARPSSMEGSGSVASDMVEETSIGELRTAYSKGWFTVSEYVEATVDRIRSMDKRGPVLNAVIELNPEAMDIAEQLDRETRQGVSRGPLHGVPVLVKDLFATNDRMRTTAGSLALARNAVIRDAFLIETLRNAGAVIIGKTNLTEFSNFRGGTRSGWSSRGGQTVNPYVLTHSAWGSSTGSAVGAAASYAPFTVGLETDGSIICPASACGVVGLKPTTGLVSRNGVLGISFTQDSPGPMGRTVEDVAYALGAMVGYDPADMAYGQFAHFAPAARFETLPVPNAGTRDYTKALDPAGLKGARIGVCRSMFEFDPVADAHVEVALDAMRDAGAEIIDDIYMEAAAIVNGDINRGAVLITEFAWGFQDFLDTYMPDGPVTSLADVVNFNYEHADETMVFGGQEGLEVSLEAGSIDDAWYQEQVARNIEITRDQGIDLTMDTYKLDALVAPSTAIPSSLAEEAFLGSSTRVASMAGYPSLTLPIGYTNGLPAGLHMFGRAFSEATLLKLAYSLEQTLQARKVPQYLEEQPWDDGEAPVNGDGTGG